MPATPKKKLYCYVDETGQDPALSVFIVVAVVSAGDQERLRDGLVAIEEAAGVAQHNSKPARRLRYIELALERNLGGGEVFFGSYRKPLPFFLPMLEVVEQAIRAKASASYEARVFVDGIDQKKAAELTNALRLHGVSLGMVRGRRDESEPIIRLADMWAGCIRGAILGRAEERALLERATEAELHHAHKRKNPLRGVFFVVPAILPCGRPISAIRSGLRQDLQSDSSRSGGRRQTAFGASARPPCQGFSPGAHDDFDRPGSCPQREDSYGHLSVNNLQSII